MAKLWSSLWSTTYSKFVLIIDESSEFDGIADKFVYIAVEKLERKEEKNE